MTFEEQLTDFCETVRITISEIYKREIEIQEHILTLSTIVKDLLIRINRLEAIDRSTSASASASAISKKGDSPTV